MSRIVAWANSVNLSGLYAMRPVGLVKSIGREMWSSDGNFSVHGYGRISNDGFVTYCSKNKHDVELWTEGARAVMGLLNAWSK